MRPIDADSFKDHIRNSYCQECIEYNDFSEARCFACRIDDIIEDLEDTNYSSTLDMRPNIHGHWVESEEGYFSCSNCHNDAMVELYENSQKLTPFCPYCGAIMNAEVEK